MASEGNGNTHQFSSEYWKVSAAKAVPTRPAMKRMVEVARILNVEKEGFSFEWIEQRWLWLCLFGLNAVVVIVDDVFNCVFGGEGTRSIYT